MARKAWENPPCFLLPEDDPEPLPAHCIGFDILSAPTLKSAVITVQGCIGGDNQKLSKALNDLDDLLKKGSSDFHTAMFAFADHPSVVSGDVGDDRDTIVQCFSKMSSLPIGDFGVKWSSRVKDIADFIERNSSNFAKQGHTLLFDSLSIDNRALLDRCVAWLLLTIPALNQEALMRVGRLLQNVDDVRLARMLGRISPDSMRILVENLQNVFTIALFDAESRRASAHACLNLLGAMLSLLHKANTAIVSRGLVKFSSFYNATAIEFDEDAIISDFRHWLKVREDPTSNLFTFSRFPCLVDTRFKSKLLQFEGIISHQNAQQEAIVAALFSIGGRRRNIENEMYCILQVRRDRLLETTVDQMTKNSARFNKPLKVVFVGEEGVDAGGVTKEFFQLTTRQLFNQGFGMFTQMEPSRVLWFMPDIGTEQLQREYFLVGQLLGLAAYNNVIIDVAFPQLLYRKILGFEPDMEDLKEIDPELANGLQKLLEYDENAPGAGKIEDVFCRTFTYEHELFGSKVEIELCPGGANKELTAENRKEYVRLTVKYLLTDGVSRSFEQFKRGFLSVAARDLISTMHPEELEMLLCGQKSLDFKELQESCTYEGYTERDLVVQWFWKILQNDLTVEQQKKFLHFATGSDRIPVGGLKELKFKIGKNGDTDDQLPTSHTCFNHFLLPKYSSEAILRMKLLLAIENCEGFGLR